MMVSLKSAANSAVRTNFLGCSSGVWRIDAVEKSVTPRGLLSSKSDIRDQTPNITQATKAMIKMIPFGFSKFS